MQAEIAFNLILERFSNHQRFKCRVDRCENVDKNIPVEGCFNLKGNNLGGGSYIGER